MLAVFARPASARCVRDGTRDAALAAARCHLLLIFLVDYNFDYNREGL